jgi:hypothetical protein
LVRTPYDNSFGVGLLSLHKAENEPNFSPGEENILDEFLKKKEFKFFEIMSKTPDRICETGKHDLAISYLALPIKDIKNNLIGVLRIPRNFKESIFTDDDVDFIEAIIDRLKSVLEKERFLKAKLKILNTINFKINSLVDQDKILNSVLKAATDEIGFEFATIQLADENKNLIWTEKVKKNPNIKGALEPVRLLFSSYRFSAAPI